MNDLFIYISLGVSALLFILSSVIYKKFRIWKLILLIITGVAYGIIKFFPDIITFISIELLTEYYTYFLFFVLILVAVTFKNKIKITQNLTDFDFFELEKELEDVKNVSDLLRLRFINTIGLLDRGLIFYENGFEEMFLTERAAELIGTKENELTLEEYTNHIIDEDVTQYLQVIKKLNKKNPSFEVKYRVKRGNSYTWLSEKGKIFNQGNKEYIVSTVKGLDIKLFPETSIQELDTLPDELQLTQLLMQAKKDKEAFYMVLMHLTNIPDINRRFGRDVGNLMISEYIKKMRYHFAREHNSIFRITGIEFALIIKDEKKYEVLKRALLSGGELINLKLSIGGIQQIVYPNVGIVKHDPWTNYEVNDFMSLGHKSLEEAIRNNKKNYSIFGE